MLKITAKFDNTESAQSAGRRIREMENIHDIQYLSPPAADRQDIIYGTNITASKSYLTSSGHLSVNPVFTSEAECKIVVTAPNESASKIRSVIFNAGGYDCRFIQ